MDERVRIFIEEFEKSLTTDSFIKLTLSKPVDKAADIKNIYLRIIQVKEEKLISATYRYETNDQTKNFSFEDAQVQLGKWLETSFKAAVLFTSEQDLSILKSKKGKWTSFKKPPSQSAKTEVSHDREKVKLIPATAPFLKILGVADDQGQIIPKMADKYRQINKYVEIIDGLIKNQDWVEPIKIVDMGAGKGYLTFALYYYLTEVANIKCQLTGVEIRPELVEKGNEAAKLCGYKNLTFVTDSIENFKQEQIDILIALHACDTATDDSIASGIMGNARLIVTAPCCHKQIRQQLKGVHQEDPLLKYGIFQERQYEMVTDTIRALTLESKGYKSKIFEFVSNEHTRKNIMLVGEKRDSFPPSTVAEGKISAIKAQYGIKYHHLEKALTK